MPGRRRTGSACGNRHRRQTARRRRSLHARSNQVFLEREPSSEFKPDQGTAAGRFGARGRARHHSFGHREQYFASAGSRSGRGARAAAEGRRAGGSAGQRRLRRGLVRSRDVRSWFGPGWFAAGGPGCAADRRRRAHVAQRTGWGGTQGAASLRRARNGDGDPGALPGDQARSWACHRQRLLLRRLSRDAIHRGGSCRDRGTHG